MINYYKGYKLYKMYLKTLKKTYTCVKYVRILQVNLIRRFIIYLLIFLSTIRNKVSPAAKFYV